MSTPPSPAAPLPGPPLTVLIDDVRCFRDRRTCRVARSSAAGVRLLAELADQHIDDLWLDHDLGGDDTIWPVIRLLETAWENGRPHDIATVHIHASGAGPAHRMGISLRRAQYRTVRSVDLGMWTR